MTITLLTPRLRATSVAEIPLADLAGADLVVLDVDNTLVVPETILAPDAVRDWVRALAQRTRVLLVSNSLSIRRRRAALEQLFGCSVLRTRAKKPFRGVWAAIERQTGVRPSARTVVIGDRLMPDIMFGNLVGARTILVQPLSQREAWWIRLQRVCEERSLRQRKSLEPF